MIVKDLLLLVMVMILEDSLLMIMAMIVEDLLVMIMLMIVESSLLMVMVIEDYLQYFSIEDIYHLNPEDDDRNLTTEIFHVLMLKTTIFRNHFYWVDAKVSADFLKNVFKRCSATMDAWFSCI